MYYKIAFPADFKNLPPLRDLAVHVALLQGFDEQKAEHLRSVVDEMCNNAIEFGSQSTSEVILEIYADEKNIKITCHDQGHGNKLTAAELKEKLNSGEEIKSVRGRGMRVIVKSFVDEIDIKDRKEGGLTVTATLHK